MPRRVAETIDTEMPEPRPAGAGLPPIDNPPTTAATDDESPEPQRGRENEIRVAMSELTPEYLDSLPRHTNPIDRSPAETGMEASGNHGTLPGGYVVIGPETVALIPPSPPTHLAEEERAYFWHAMDERKKATLAAEQAMNTLTAKRAAADSYRDYLWTKYALGDADSIDTETGAIART